MKRNNELSKQLLNEAEKRIMNVEFTITERKEEQHKLEDFLRVFAQMLLVGWDVTIVEPKIDGKEIKLY